MLLRIKEKKERALGTKLFLKAERCNSPKCVMVRRPYCPGMHGQARKRGALSDYGRQLQEKQKIQFYYGLNTRQMRNLFKRVSSPEEIIALLRERLDQVVFALGFAASPRIARQLISHGHVLVNGKRVTVPSYRVTVGDVITLRPESSQLKIFEGIHERLKSYEPPQWLKLNKDELRGECVASSSVEETQFPFDIQLVGQFFSQ